MKAQVSFCSGVNRVMRLMAVQRFVATTANKKPLSERAEVKPSDAS